MEELYKLNVNRSLDKFDKNTLKVDDHKNIYFLFYTIKNINHTPYLQFLLKKNNNKLYFPKFKKTQTFFKNFTKIKNDIVNIGNKKMNYSKKYEFNLKGSTTLNKNLIVVYEINNLPEIITYISSDTFYFTSLYEILYFKSFLNFKINYLVHDFFCSNYKNFLPVNENKISIKHPIQIYLDVDNKTNIFTLMNNYDDKINKKFITHTQNITKTKSIVRCLLIENENTEIHGNKFYFSNSNNFLIISIFD